MGRQPRAAGPMGLRLTFYDRRQPREPPAALPAGGIGTWGAPAAHTPKGGSGIATGQAGLTVSRPGKGIPVTPWMAASGILAHSPKAPTAAAAKVPRALSDVMPAWKARLA